VRKTGTLIRVLCPALVSGVANCLEIVFLYELISGARSSSALFLKRWWYLALPISIPARATWLNWSNWRRLRPLIPAPVLRV